MNASEKSAIFWFCYNLKQITPIADKEIRHSLADREVIKMLRAIDKESAELYQNITDDSWYA